MNERLSVKVYNPESLETSFSLTRDLNIVEKKFVNLPVVVNRPCIIFSTNLKTKYNGILQPMHVQFTSANIEVTSDIPNSAVYLIELSAGDGK